MKVGNRYRLICFRFDSSEKSRFLWFVFFIWVFGLLCASFPLFPSSSPLHSYRFFPLLLLLLFVLLHFFLFLLLFLFFILSTPIYSFICHLFPPFNSTRIPPPPTPFYTPPLSLFLLSPFFTTPSSSSSLLPPSLLFARSTEPILWNFEDKF